MGSISILPVSGVGIGDDSPSLGSLGLIPPVPGANNGPEGGARWSDMGGSQEKGDWERGEVGGLWLVLVGLVGGLLVGLLVGLLSLVGFVGVLFDVGWS